MSDKINYTTYVKKITEDVYSYFNQEYYNKDEKTIDKMHYSEYHINHDSGIITDNSVNITLLGENDNILITKSLDTLTCNVDEECRYNNKYFESVRIDGLITRIISFNNCIITGSLFISNSKNVSINITNCIILGMVYIDNNEVRDLDVNFNLISEAIQIGENKIKNIRIMGNNVYSSIAIWDLENNSVKLIGNVCLEYIIDEIHNNSSINVSYNVLHAVKPRYPELFKQPINNKLSIKNSILTKMLLSHNTSHSVFIENSTISNYFKQEDNIFDYNFINGNEFNSDIFLKNTNSVTNYCLLNRNNFQKEIILDCAHTFYKITLNTFNGHISICSNYTRIDFSSNFLNGLVYIDYNYLKSKLVSPLSNIDYIELKKSYQNTKDFDNYEKVHYDYKENELHNTKTNRLKKILLFAEKITSNYGTDCILLSLVIAIVILSFADFMKYSIL